MQWSISYLCPFSEKGEQAHISCGGEVALCKTKITSRNLWWSMVKIFIRAEELKMYWIMKTGTVITDRKKWFKLRWNTTTVQMPEIGKTVETPLTKETDISATPSCEPSNWIAEFFKMVKESMSRYIDARQKCMDHEYDRSVTINFEN
jgi:hypothetical protein